MPFVLVFNSVFPSACEDSLHPLSLTPHTSPSLPLTPHTSPSLPPPPPHSTHLPLTPHTSPSLSPPPPHSPHLPLTPHTSPSLPTPPPHSPHLPLTPHTSPSLPTPPPHSPHLPLTSHTSPSPPHLTLTPRILSACDVQLYRQMGSLRDDLALHERVLDQLITLLKMEQVCMTSRALHAGAIIFSYQLQ